MNHKIIAPILFTILFSTTLFSRATVTHWRIVKGPSYLQEADNTPASTTTNWSMFSIVETALAGDATSVTIEGGNIPGSLSYDLEGSEWELDFDYPSKAALDAVFPSDASYSIILSGGTLGSLTQQVIFAADAYPQVPYLTGSDYSDALALEALEPFELNWNPAGAITTVSLEIYTGAELDEGDDLFSLFSNNFTGVILPWNLFVANSNYNGYIDFANATLQSGSGGFGIDGDVSFNTALAFHIDTVNTAIGYDDFNDNAMDINKWSVAFPPEEAVDTFSVTNGRLEYTSAGTGDTFIAWFWEASELSYTQDWSIAVDITDTLATHVFGAGDETYFGILVMADGDLDNNISAEFINSSNGREAAMFVTSGGVEDVLTQYAPVSEETIAVKISFDATTKRLYTTYSTGGDYMMQTNYSSIGWGMTDASVFNPVIFSGNVETEITAGQIYADNFRIQSGKVLTNHVGLTELEFLHSYGDGTIFLPNNFIKVNAATSYKIRDITLTTSGGDTAALTYPLDTGTGLEWDVEIPLGFSTTWNSANDGDWTVTFGFNDGTYQSTLIPFTKADGTTPMPNFFYKPSFIAPSPANNSTTNETSLSFTWIAAGPNANVISINEIVDGDERKDANFLFSDGLPGDSLSFIDLAIEGPLSTTNHGPIVFDEGFHRMRIVEGYARAAYNADGVPYTVVKLAESDIIFTITSDADGDNLDDDWEIAFFGSTNAVNGGAYEDFDFDGMLNIEEFIAGVNPTNGNSFFVVEEPSPSLAGFVVNWNSVDGRKYSIYWTKSLLDGFTTVATDLLYPQSSYTDTVHTVEGCGFYYIDVQLEN